MGGPGNERSGLPGLQGCEKDKNVVILTAVTSASSLVAEGDPYGDRHWLGGQQRTLHVCWCSTKHSPVKTKRQSALHFAGALMTR